LERGEDRYQIEGVAITQSRRTMDALVSVAAALAAVPPLKRMARTENVDVHRWRACRKLALELQWRTDQQHGLNDRCVTSKFKADRKRKHVTDAAPPWATRIC
jgi:hypothetical protein